MPESLQSTVESHAFVAGLEPRHIERLAKMSREMCFEKGVVIFPEGDAGREFYLLVHGMVALEVRTATNLLRIQTLHAGDEFGWSAVLSGKNKVLQARALERTDVLVFDGAALSAAFNEDTSFGFAIAMRLLDVVSDRLNASRVQLLDLVSVESKRAGT
jgi:CRP-like cAMP-binding protein